MADECRWGDGPETGACWHPAACGCKLMSAEEFQAMLKKQG